jgi:hypothetical protein
MRITIAAFATLLVAAHASGQNNGAFYGPFSDA